MIKNRQEVYTTKLIPATEGPYGFPEVPVGTPCWVFRIDTFGKGAWYNPFPYSAWVEVQGHRRGFGFGAGDLTEAVSPLARADHHLCPCGKPNSHAANTSEACNPHPCTRCDGHVYYHLDKLCSHCGRNSD